MSIKFELLYYVSDLLLSEDAPQINRAWLCIDPIRRHFSAQFRRGKLRLHICSTDLEDFTFDLVKKEDKIQPYLVVDISSNVSSIHSAWEKIFGWSGTTTIRCFSARLNRFAMATILPTSHFRLVTKNFPLTNSFFPSARTTLANCSRRGLKVRNFTEEGRRMAPQLSTSKTWTPSTWNYC